ncbi:dCTP deaminase domain-containing protein [Fusobacterium mortiferum]|jgi:dCTP deaminase|uniref:dCTP deaminase domain-containing protein n=1 Tax=Fusobacterium mortiferum TaxID=850 RepID=UPI001F285521|nr:hypothetical protein [Fusobacterium mortiferum]MCF2699473.1 hypothetical protein [Fusobacterium mortiferum]MCI6383043.1 hypothetical protein [Fusobacterium mortiferum]
MFLKSEYFNEQIIIEGFDKKLLGPISHDLTIKDIIVPSTKNKETYIDLDPQKVIFIECEQVIELPNDLIGLVHNKNSRIRLGLDLASPIYQPGHKTRIFFRLTNISTDIITLKKGDNIAQLSLIEVKGDNSIKYNGEFQNEFDFKGLGKYNDEYIVKKLENKLSLIEDMEKKIYAGVAAIVTAFVALFGFLNAGIKIGSNINSGEVFSLMTLSLITLTTLLFGLIGLFFSKKTLIAIFCLIVAVVAFIPLMFHLF